MIATRRRLRAAPARGGWTLIDIMVVVLIVGVLTALAGQVFVATFAVARDAGRSEERGLRLDGTLRRLRADAWRASSFETRVPGSVTIETNDGSRVTWATDAGGSLTRRAAPSPEGEASWVAPNAGFGFEFGSDRGLLIVTVTEGASAARREIVLSSQVIEARRISP